MNFYFPYLGKFLLWYSYKNIPKHRKYKSNLDNNDRFKLNK